MRGGRSSWGRAPPPPVEVKPRSVTISYVDGDGAGGGGSSGVGHWCVEAGVAGVGHRHHLLVEVWPRSITVSPPDAIILS